MERTVIAIFFAALTGAAIAYPSLPSNFDISRQHHNIANPGQLYEIVYIIENPEEFINWKNSSPYNEDYSNDEREYNNEESVDAQTPDSSEVKNEANINDRSDDSLETSEVQDAVAPLRRSRRQAEAAMGLALSHSDRNGNPRPVGRPHGFADLNVSGINRNNYHASGSAGVGAVAWRSRNNRHSIGIGATVDRYRGRSQGYRYQGRPNMGFGIGYRMRF